MSLQRLGRIKMIGKNTIPYTVFLVFILLISLRLYPAFTLPIFMDEGDDLYILSKDTSSLPFFFSEQYTHAWDQSRLPHLIAALVVGLTGTSAENIFNRLGVLRLIFLLFHIGYLLISYRLVHSVLRRQAPALLYLLLLTTSCYLASFSIAMLTSGDAVYLFFHILCIKIFYDNLQNAEQSDRIFHQFLLFSLAIACCIAGKLFGVMLLMALCIFHFFCKKNLHNLRISAASPRKLFFIATAFLAMILAINIIPLSSVLKTYAVLSAGIVYLCVMIRLIIHEKKKPAPYFELNFYQFWGLLSYISFTFVLVLSPIYLNLQNLLNIFGWFSTWNMGVVAPDASFSEAFRIMFIKFGVLPSLILFPAFFIMLFHAIHNHGKTIAVPANGFWAMILIVFLVHFLFISIIQFKLVWHSLAVFPFLYLPFVWLFHVYHSQKKQIASYLILALIILIAGENLYRYSNWYPYGHLDGGQYGKQYVGINKPCFVTFEAIPLFYDYIRQKENNGDRSIRQINVRGSSAPVLNNYLRKMLIRYFRSHGHQTIHFVSRELRWDPSDLILSSPIYNPEFESFLLENNYHIVHPLSIAGLTIGHVWQHGQDQ